jgi:hypothetical protein
MLFVSVALPGKAIERPIGSSRRIYKNVVEGIVKLTVSCKVTLTLTVKH